MPNSTLKLEYFGVVLVLVTGVKRGQLLFLRLGKSAKKCLHKKILRKVI